MNTKIVEYLIDIVGSDWKVTELKQKLPYLFDKIEFTVRPKAGENSIVIKPIDSNQISAILKYANDNKIPVVVRGRGTGPCGGSHMLKKV